MQSGSSDSHVAIATPEVRPASTVVVVSDGPRVLLAERSRTLAFVAGAHVFPGGAVDPDDGAAHQAALWDPFDDEHASRRLGIESGGLSYWSAAIRETFEEAGVLVAAAVDGVALDSDHPLIGSLGEWRRRCANGERLFDLCATNGVRFDASLIRVLSRWVTPVGAPRRFDTRFFVAEAPKGQVASADGHETASVRWWDPEEALAACDRGDIDLILPTRRSLEHLVRAGSLSAWCAELDAFPTGPAPGGRTTLLPSRDTVERGQLATLDPLVHRLVAPNPGPMTGPGTNTYVVGDLGDETAPVVVIDPGPDDAGHVGQIVDIVGDRLAAIVYTHTHPDHWPAGDLLNAATGAPRIGWSPDSGDDPAGGVIVLDHCIAEDGPVCWGNDDGGWVLRARHTPGHSSDHICLLLDADTPWCFSGDHLMVGSTVVIAPPDGDMDAYLESLSWLSKEPARRLGPGHGPVHADSSQLAQQVIGHRERREDQLLAVLGRIGPSTVEELATTAYRGVGGTLRLAAAQTAWAHLRRLARRGCVNAVDPDGAAVAVGVDDTFDSVWQVC